MSAAPPRHSGTALLIGAGVLAVFAAGVFYSLRLIGGSDEDVAGLYLFPPGTTWTYETVAGKERHRGQLRVKKVEAGKVWMESRRDGPSPSTDWVEDHVEYVENGYLLRSVVENGVLGTPIRVYRLGSRKGQSWESDPHGTPGEYLIHHLGLTRVELPAGRFENVRCLRFVLKAIVQDSYLKPGIGLVKQEESVPQDPELGEKYGLPRVMSLVEFRKVP
jgi:hypothetical protein